MTAPSRESVEALRRGLVAGVAEMHAFVALCDAYIATYSQPAPGVSAKEAAREWLAKNIVGYRERIRACQDLGAMPPEQIASLAALIERREREVAREAGEEERCQRCSNIVEPGERHPRGRKGGSVKILAWLIFVELAVIIFVSHNAVWALVPTSAGLAAMAIGVDNA